jgi:hypothetical protein
VFFRFENTKYNFNSTNLLKEYSNNYQLNTYALSKINATPWPTPMHMVAKPY